MKKIFGLVAAVLLCATTAFAKGSYAGDAQLMMGAGFDTTQMKLRGDKTDMDSGLFLLNFTTHHLWGTSDFLKIGFTGSFEGGIGGTTKFAVNGMEASSDDRFIGARYAMFFGPCVGIGFGNLVRFNITPGFSMLCELGSVADHDAGTATFYCTPALGFGIDLQAKFFPKAVVSPVVAYRYTANYSKAWAQATVKLDDYESEPDHKENAANVIAQSHSFYVGISWNW